MPGVSGVTVVTNARVYYTPRAAAGAPGARHSLRPLFGEGQIFMKTSGASRRENADLRLAVIASAAKQSILSLRGEMDCFVAALLAMTAWAV